MIALLVVLIIVAFFYERARRGKNYRLMSLFTWIGAFFIGLVISPIISGFLLVTFLDDMGAPEMIVRVLVAIASIWLTYLGLKRILNPVPKKPDTTTLDSGLMPTEKPERSSPERYNKDER